MEALFDHEQLIHTLLRGVLMGYWTVEHLDRPSPAWAEIEHDRVRSVVPRDTRNPHDLRKVPAMKYTNAGTVRPFRNLVREWIEKHPKEWELMVAEQAEKEMANV